MINLASLSTFSGLFIFLALVAALNRWFTLSGVLLTVAGAGGLGVFWERWSRSTGYDVQVAALWHAVPPTAAQWTLLATHAAMLACGLVTVAALTWRQERESSA